MSLLLFLVILLVLVLAHELGHFIVAKRAGIRVDEFAFGFPPRLYSIKRGETAYSFNLLPIGGYVKIHGEDPSESQKDDHDHHRSFAEKPKHIQAAVIVAGIVFNIILAWILVSSTLMIGVPAPADELSGAALLNAKLMVTGVVKDSPAERAGLKPGDTLSALFEGAERVEIKSAQAVSSFIGPREGHTLTLVYERKKKAGELLLVPVSGIVPGAAAIGIEMDMVGTLKLPPHIAMYEGVKKTYQYTVMTAVGIGSFLGETILGKANFSEVMGPVGIVGAVGDAAGIGFTNLLLFTAIISINLAIINLLPFPALDGGRLFFVIVEVVSRKQIPARIANSMNITGFALLMLLMLLVTYHDIVRLVQ